MMSTLRPINEIAYIISGGTPKTTVREYWDGNIPWLSVKDFNNGSKYVYSAEKSITELGLNHSAANLLQNEDIVISARGTVGLIAKISQPMAFNQSCFGVRSKGEIDQDYLYYAMKYSSASLKLLTQGSVFSTINRSTFDKWKIPVPDITTQRKISKILSSIDKKLVLNNQLNDYLTDFSSTMYKKFINQSSGKWGILSDIVDLKKETINSNKKLELPYLPIDIIPMKRIGVESFRPHEEAKSSLQLFEKDDIVIGAMRVYFHRVILAPCRGITRNTCFVLRPMNKNLREFALLSCFQNEAIEFANLHSKGSTMPYAVWKGSFENCPVFIPNEHDLEVFSIRMSPLIDKIRDIYKENSALINLRNGLLSQLLSGKIDLSKFN